MTEPTDGSTVTQLWLPSTMKDEVLQELHDKMGHQGIDRVEKLVRSRFYWPNIRSDIQHWISMCERCNLAKMPHLTVRTTMHSIVAREPLEVIAIDFTVLEPARNGRSGSSVMEFRVGYTRTKDGILTPRLSPSCTRFTRSRKIPNNPVPSDGKRTMRDI